MSTANRHVTTVSSPNAETIAAALGGRKSGGGWMARCPAYEDRKPSLSIQEADGGQVLVHCFAGCAQDAILEALRQRGLWSSEAAVDRRPVSCPPSAAVSQPSSPSPNRLAGRSPQALWTGYSPVSPSHPYLARKRIGTHGARCANDQGALVLPLFDAVGMIQSLQYIAADGGKRFLAGATVKGHFFLVGDARDGDSLCIAEGFATAATIHEATGIQTATAFNAGNLLPVAKALQHKWPDRKLVICADDDAAGLAKAREAAR